MANKSIKELPKATQIQEDDALPMQQGSITKQVTGLTMTLWLLDMADGHGGVTDFQKLSESGLEKTYQFTMADTTKYTFTVTDGNGVADFQHSVIGLVHTYKLIMDNGQKYTMTIKDGEKGDKGDNAYVWFRFASEKPTSSSSSMGTEPDAWIGFYSGNKAVAPTDPMEYTWAPFKGDKGNTGAPATIVTNKTEYQVSNSGTIVPSGNWSTAIPPVTPGKYLWARTTTQFNTGAANYAYSISRFGIDGSGSVVTVNDVSPDENGNVKLTAEQLQCLGLSGGTMTGPINMNGQAITGLNDPVEETDAVRKAYVDAQIQKAAPYNLFHNSYFVNPVNQRGNTSYSGIGFTIDRWRFWEEAGKLTIADGYIAFSGGALYHHIGEKIDTTKVYTAAYKDTDNNVYVLSGKFSDSPYDDAGRMNFYLGDSGLPIFRIYQKSTGGETKIVWAAMYEGVFTKETLPDYHYKGYTTELLECQKYYYRLSGEYTQIGCGYSDSATSVYLIIVLPTAMRIQPTAMLTANLMAFINGTAYQANGKTAAAVQMTGNTCKIGFTSFSELPKYYPAVVQFQGDGYLELSAEL